MRKKVLAAVAVFSVLAGISLGVLGHWLFTEKLPRDRAMAVAKKQQEEMNRMMRSGEVTDVKPDGITLKVNRSGDPAVEVGTELTLRVDAGTTVQEGMNMLKRPGQEVDVTRYVKRGMKVDVLERDGRALVVHWELSGRGRNG